MTRVSSKQRLKLANQAEIEIQRYAHDHYLWHKHLHNVELDPIQVLKCVEMDQNKNTVDFSCRRTGKTATKELYLLKFLACNADQELGIVAPRVAQSEVALRYHLEAIQRSPILAAYIRYERGRPRLADGSYQFANGSKAAAYGIMSQVDGGDLTAASLEEVDDMPKERLYSNFLLMLGSTRRLGASQDSKNDPQIRITGVMKGADTLSELIDSGEYHCLPLVDVHLGIEMGIINEAFMLSMQVQLPSSEYIRQLLCINVSATNLIWEKYVRRALQVGLMARLEIAGPLPGMQYEKKGLVSFGYDAGGHGENPASSKHALVVSEQVGNFITFPYVRTWPAGADDGIVRRDLLALCEYFSPDMASGDAYGVGMLTQLNDDLFEQGLVKIDRRTIGEGDSTASTWPEWPFSPMRFEGMVKHSMAQALRSVFHAKQAAIPYFDDSDSDPELDDWRTFIRQLTNIIDKPTSKSYSSYVMVNKKQGDDLFDAAMASVWGLVCRGAYANPSTVVLTNQKTREQLLQRTS